MHLNSSAPRFEATNRLHKEEPEELLVLLGKITRRWLGEAQVGPVPERSVGELEPPTGLFVSRIEFEIEEIVPFGVTY